MLTFEEFKASLKESSPPENTPRILQALWWDAKNNWDMAHQIAQDESSQEGAWVHAYLHRKEGDEFNAGYWYNKAKQTKSHDSLEIEWESIVKTLLKQS